MTALARFTLLAAATCLLIGAILLLARDWRVAVTLVILALVAGMFERLLSLDGSA